MAARGLVVHRRNSSAHRGRSAALHIYADRFTWQLVRQGSGASADAEVQVTMTESESKSAWGYPSCRRNSGFRDAENGPTCWSKPDLVFAPVGGPWASLSVGVGDHSPHSIDPGVLVDQLDQVLI